MMMPPFHVQLDREDITTKIRKISSITNTGYKRIIENMLAYVIDNKLIWAALEKDLPRKHTKEEIEEA